MSRRQKLRLAVIQTLAYAEVFSAKLESWQLRRFTISSDSFSPLELDQEWQALLREPEMPKILPNQFSANHLASQNSKKVKLDKWREVSRAVGYLRRIPWIESIWVTGGLAVGNVQADDDIDFLIVTKPGCLWTTRAVVSVMGQMLGKLRRRYHQGKQLKDKWCCNVWLETTSLTLPVSQNDLYSARELVQAKPVYTAQAGVAGQFIKANRWAAAFSRQGWQNALVQADQLLSQQSFLWYFPGLKKFITLIGQIINPFLYQAQWQLMKNHLKQENVSINSAYFHPELRSSLIQQEYERIKLLLKKRFYA